MNLKPVNGHILVEIPKDTSGIIIPQSVSDSTQEGIVIVSADDVRLTIDGLRPQPGTVVRWERYAESDGEFEYKNGDKTVTAVVIPEGKITAYWSKA